MLTQNTKIGFCKIYCRYRYIYRREASQGETQYFIHVVRDQKSRTIGITTSKVLAEAGGRAVGGVIIRYSINEILQAFDNYLILVKI